MARSAPGTIADPFAARIPEDLADAGTVDLGESELRLNEVSISDIEPIIDVVSYFDLAESAVTGVRFTGAQFEELSLTDVIFEDCEFSGAAMMEANLVRVEFRRCRMVGLVASGLKARDISFDECRLDDANFRMSSFERSQFRGGDLGNADFSEASLSQVQLAGVRLGRCQFNRVKLDRVSFFGSQLEEIQGAEYLRGAVISSEQLLNLAIPLTAALGIQVQD